MKTCKECGELLSYDNFTKSKNVKDGYENKCKKCRNKARLKHRNTCLICGNEFLSQNKVAYYCSQKCKPQSQRDRLTVECSICGKEKEIVPSQLKYSKDFYCSEDCKNKGYSLKYSGENSPKYYRVKLKCSYCGDIVERNKYESMKYENYYCSNECRSKHYSKLFKGELNPMFGKERPDMVGDKNHAWNPNRTHIQRRKERKLKENTQWRRDVMKRDNYTCSVCNQIGGDMVAHHKDGYNWCKEGRLDVKNGATMCEKCHADFHSQYGYGNNTSNQFYSFIKEKAIPNQAYKETLGRCRD